MDLFLANEFFVNDVIYLFWGGVPETSQFNPVLVLNFQPSGGSVMTSSRHFYGLGLYIRAI